MCSSLHNRKRWTTTRIEARNNLNPQHIYIHLPGFSYAINDEQFGTCEKRKPFLYVNGSRTPRKCSQGKKVRVQQRFGGRRCRLHNIVQEITYWPHKQKHAPTYKRHTHDHTHSANLAKLGCKRKTRTRLPYEETEHHNMSLHIACVSSRENTVELVA